MDENQTGDPSPRKESLADLGPSPYVIDGAEPPHYFVPGMGTTLLLAGIGSIGAFLLIEATPRHTQGATRSMQLKWQQRLLEIEAIGFAGRGGGRSSPSGTTTAKNA
jgi:hypothetical protein